MEDIRETAWPVGARRRRRTGWLTAIARSLMTIAGARDTVNLPAVARLERAGAPCGEMGVPPRTDLILPSPASDGQAAPRSTPISDEN